MKDFRVWLIMTAVSFVMGGLNIITQHKLHTEEQKYNALEAATRTAQPDSYVTFQSPAAFDENRKQTIIPHAPWQELYDHDPVLRFYEAVDNNARNRPEWKDDVII